MIFLWTDVIYWFLIAAIIFLIIAPKPRHIIVAWQSVGQSKMAVASGVVLFFYALIALLDCIHFKLGESHNIVSVLDLILSPLNQAQETTYSAPFAVKDLNYPTTGVSLVSLIFKSAGVSVLIAGLFSSVVYLRTRKFKRVLTLTVSVFVVIAMLTFLYLMSRYYHILGTDKVGQDVFYQTIKSIRTGVLIGSLTTLVMFPFALFFGTVAGYYRGWVDDVVQYIYTTLSSIPSVLLIVAFMLMLEVIMGRYPAIFDNIMMRADFRLLALCVIFGITSWTSLCRLLRAETLKLREQDYVKAGIVLSTTHSKILKLHIIPNLMHIVIITVAMEFSSLVLAEAVLSYIGVGVDSSTFSWGNMINAARLELARDPVIWWSLTAAFFFMVSLVLPANLFADVLQKAFDPRARSR